MPWQYAKWQIRDFCTAQSYKKCKSFVTTLIKFLHLCLFWLKKNMQSGIQISFLMFLHIPSTWVKIVLHSENQLPGLLGSDLKVWLVVLVVDGWSNQILCHSQLKLWLSCDVTILLFYFSSIYISFYGGLLPYIQKSVMTVLIHKLIKRQLSYFDL
jgi:hypothetical protein